MRTENHKDKDQIPRSRVAGICPVICDCIKTLVRILGTLFFLNLVSAILAQAFINITTHTIFLFFNTNTKKVDSVLSNPVRKKSLKFT